MAGRLYAQRIHRPPLPTIPDARRARAVDRPPMTKLTSTLVLAALAAALTAASALAAPPSYQVQIRHQLKGCHTWSISGGAFKGKQALTAVPGTQLTFIDNDVMP